MKKLKYIIFSMFLIAMSFTSVYAANRLNNLDIDILIDEKGHAHIKEVWDMVVTQDTEIYKEEYNLGNMSIYNFSVRDEDREYTLDDSWDIDASFSEKKNKYGINYTSNGLELCWGISEYGNKKYTITYSVSNAIFNTSDAQVFYMKLVNNLDFPPKNFEVTISGPQSFSDTLDVWGYGYKGYAYVQNGKIYMSNEENTSLSKGDYAVLLIKFPLNTFVSLDNTYSQYENFDDVLNAAEEGSYEYDYGETMSFVDKIILIISTIFPFLMFIGIGTAVAISSQKYKFGSAGKNIKMKEINYFRDIPCDKNVYKAFFIAQAYSLNKEKTDFIGTLFLKWFMEGRIQIQNIEKKKIFKTSTEAVLVLNDSITSDNSVEEEMFKIMKEASVDGVLENNELKEWAQDNYDEFYKWFDKAEAYGRNIYVNDGYVEKVKSKYLIKDATKADAVELAGLKKYLTEFSNIKEKEAIEVHLWKEYLMYAQIFGIADKVAKQFKDLYPEVVQEMNSYDTDVMVFVRLNAFSRTMVRSASSARSAARSYSSGGGGFSSGGGGGGSFGGGGGGSR